MRVAVSVHGRWHAFELARELHRAGALARVLTTYPRFAARRFLPADVELRTAPALELVRRAHDATHIGPAPDAFIARAFGRFAAHNLPRDLDLLVAWSGGALEAIAAAHDAGAKVVLERGSTHIAHQRDVLAAEYGLLGLPAPRFDERLVERELAEYDAADAIAVPTRYAARTFTERGMAEEKLLVNAYGVDLERFAALEPVATEVPRILFVGRVGPRKGVPALLEAFQPLAGGAELHLVGPVEPEMKTLLARAPVESVHVHGPVAADALPAHYARAAVFCLPSLEEGMALVLLQAMAAGCAVVATPESGAEDLIADGAEGRLVPANLPETLSAVLADLLDDASKRAAMGAAARRRVARGFRWTDYGERALAYYRALIGP